MIAILIFLLLVLIFMLACDKEMLQSTKDWMWRGSWKYPGWGHGGLPGNPSGDPSGDPSEELAEDPEEESLANLSSKEDGDTAQGFLGSRAPPRAWDFSTSEYNRLGADKMFRSYEQDLEANVDEAIRQSHTEYVEDTDFLATTGASHASDNSHFNPAVSFVGIPRGAMYKHLGSSSTSRTTQSETPESVLEIRGSRTPYVL